MCFFLTIAVPAGHVERIGEAFGRGFQSHASENQSIAAAIPAGHKAYHITSGMCSCDLYARPSDADPSDPTSHLRRKYESKGWSAAKIERALNQAASNKGKHHRAVAGLRSDVIERLAALCRSAGSVAFLVHWYNGDVDTERLPLRRAAPCDCDELPTRAQQLIEDEVVVAAVQRVD